MSKMLKCLYAVVLLCLLCNEAIAGRKKKLCCNGPHESYSAEKKSCPPDTCAALVSRYDCTNTDVWPPPAPGCVCDAGYFRPEKGEDCVPLCDCPQMKDSTDCKPKQPKCGDSKEGSSEEKSSEKD